MVPGTGIEPVRCRHRGILSPVRLPVPPPRLIQLTLLQLKYNEVTYFCQ